MYSQVAKYTSFRKYHSLNKIMINVPNIAIDHSIKITLYYFYPNYIIIGYSYE